MNFSKEFKLINLTQKFQDILGIDAVKAEKISRYITEDKEDDDVSDCTALLKSFVVNVVLDS